MGSRRAKKVACGLAGLVFSLGASTGQAGEYLGEFCWDLDFSVPRGLSALIRVAVTDMGDGHYFLNGRSNSSSGSVLVVHGNAELNGDQVLFSGMSTNTTTDYVLSQSTDWVLDAATLNGEFNRILTRYDRSSGSFEQLYGTATLTSRICPRE